VAKKEIRDGVEVVWAYRPDDRSKQGKTETLERDVADMKVREGLARYAEAKPAADDDSGASEKVDPGTIVTDATTGRSTKVAGSGPK
jgi:hypothetical protein